MPVSQCVVFPLMQAKTVQLNSHQAVLIVLALRSTARRLADVELVDEGNRDDALTAGMDMLKYAEEIEDLFSLHVADPSDFGL